MIDFASPRRPPGRRALTLLFLFALALGLALVKPPPALADGTTSVEVDVEGPGRVTGTEIDCPGDCLATLPWRDGMPLPARDLTAHPPPGWERVEWTGCEPKPDNPNVCTYYQDETRNGITARFVDTQAPTIDLPDFPEYRYIAAGSTHELTAAVTDNGEIDRVEFVDGLMVVTDTEAPWSGSLTFTRPLEGVKVLFARVYDTGGNSAEVSRRYHHDHHDPVVKALTNVGRHAGRAPTTVTIERRDGMLVVDVVNALDGTAAPGGAPGRGSPACASGPSSTAAPCAPARARTPLFPMPLAARLPGRHLGRRRRRQAGGCASSRWPRLRWPRSPPR